MSDYGWLVVENVAVLTAMATLVIYTGDGWWFLLLLFMNYRTTKK